MKLVDLEKMKRRWRRRAVIQHDLDTLYRRTLEVFNQQDRLAFIRAYFGSDFSRSDINFLLKNTKS